MRDIIVIPGDGIGPEVTQQAVETLDALDLGLRFVELGHINAGTFLRTGTAMSEGDFARIRDSGLVLFGAIGDPRVATTDYARGVLLRLRLGLDLFINKRPARLWHHRLSPLRDGSPRDIDCVILRENTEGLYTGVGGSVHVGTASEVAIDAEVSTAMGVARILEHAFAVARRGVCMVDKSNAVRSGGRLWQRCWADAKAAHPDVPAAHLYVDVAAMKLVSDPEQFDVIVTNNSYGDILSDISAEVAGGLGLAASANLNPVTGSGLFEPVHGTAPDIAGQGLANPLAAILSGAMLAEWLGHTSAAEAVRKAVSVVVAAGQCTADIGGSLTTEQAGAALRAQL